MVTHAEVKILWCWNNWFIKAILLCYQNKSAVCPSRRMLRSRPQNRELSTVRQASETPQPWTGRSHILQSCCTPASPQCCSWKTNISTEQLRILQFSWFWAGGRRRALMSQAATAGTHHNITQIQLWNDTKFFRMSSDADTLNQFDINEFSKQGWLTSPSSQWTSPATRAAVLFPPPCYSEVGDDRYLPRYTYCCYYCKTLQSAVTWQR